jgi:hypothetical protein
MLHRLADPCFLPIFSRLLKNERQALRKAAQYGMASSPGKAFHQPDRQT